MKKIKLFKRPIGHEMPISFLTSDFKIYITFNNLITKVTKITLSVFLNIRLTGINLKQKFFYKCLFCLVYIYN